MADQPNVASKPSRKPDDPGPDTLPVTSREASAPSLLVSGDSEVIPLVEETLTVSKRDRSTGSVRIATHTETTEAIAKVELDRHRVEVTRVPVGRIVEEAPAEREEGDTTVIPVIEERFVVVKQLYLVEEVRIRHVREQEVVSEPVMLRRQRIVVERVDADSGSADSDQASIPQRTA